MGGWRGAARDHHTANAFDSNKVRGIELLWSETCPGKVSTDATSRAHGLELLGPHVCIRSSSAGKRTHVEIYQVALLLHVVLQLKHRSLWYVLISFCINPFPVTLKRDYVPFRNEELNLVMSVHSGVYLIQPYLVWTSMLYWLIVAIVSKLKVDIPR